MDEYISRRELLARYDAEHEGTPGRARELIKHAPAADVAPVVHGRWVNHFDYMMERSGFFVCDSCKKMSREKYDYCPNCGSRMDKEDEQ